MVASILRILSANDVNSCLRNVDISAERIIFICCLPIITRLLFIVGVNTCEQKNSGRKMIAAKDNCVWEATVLNLDSLWVGCRSR